MTPPTMYAVFRAEPGKTDGGLRLFMVGEPHELMREAEAAARALGRTCVVIKLSPVSVFRGTPD